MYCIETEYKDSWKNWFVDLDPEIKYRKCMIMFEDEQFNINLPIEHKMIIRVFKKSEFKNIAFFVYFSSETERKLYKILSRTMIYRIADSKFLTGFQIVVSEK